MVVEIVYEGTFWSWCCHQVADAPINQFMAVKLLFCSLSLSLSLSDFLLFVSIKYFEHRGQ